MSTFDDLENAIVVIGRPGIAGTGITTSEKTGITTDIADLKARTLQNHANVVLAGLANGQVLIWDSVTSTWKNSTIGSTVDIYNAAGGYVGPANRFDMGDGLQAVDIGGALRKQLSAAFGNTATTVARGDHVHNARLKNVPLISATGVLSSGTRTLITWAFFLANGVTYDITAWIVIAAKNTINNGTFLLRVQIAGGTIQSIQKASVGGVPIEYNVVHVGTVVGTGAAVSIVGSVTFDSGDPTDFRSGQLIFDASPRR
jgi:hypothetical protein